ncbi:MAG TPA: bifunctional 4-hydroxy-2-oxoglutarate aldolase/2-dehydro-3-deoxy-phosphogluconate aldolase [Candidatus Saccharimonadales bacterium]|nr:bifunctional 4-hydroxy-2-oxoglutarate aldolase/2-dehydro-3-deoxy-phosphogluconate aldolase [Candidatus Saccharimonadales bacterium]
MDNAIDQIGTAGIIVILRKKCEEFIVEYLPRLVGAGLRVVEVSNTAERSADILTSLVSQWGNRLLIGAGTVRNKSEAEEAIALGAQFLISPHFDAALTDFILKRNVPYLVGCYTPSEIAAALDVGVSAIKIFPAFLGGPRYIRALLAPFPKTRFVPTGGVSPSEVPEYWNAGAWAVAIGSEINTVVGEKGWTDEQLNALFAGKRE